MPVDSPVNIIVVTDGDQVARQAVETAARNVGARCISASAGNPTALTGEQLLNLIKQAAHEPVVVMLDDRGFKGEGHGESALAFLAAHPGIRILGVLAVASNSVSEDGARVDFSVDRDGNLVEGPVDKFGRKSGGGNDTLNGDTVELLDRLNIPVVIGIGDVGKMDGADDHLAGAPLTTRAMREILKRSGYDVGNRCH